MPYAIYLRKSRADLEAEACGEGETLARHRTTLRELAAKRGHTIGKIYAEVVSGETIAARPQMQQLLKDLAAGLWEGVYVMEVERLARGDTLDQGRVSQAFLYSGAKILTPSKTYDPENEFDQEYFEFGLFMSRREYKTINRRIQAGRMQSVREGKYICSRPAYGYRKVKLKGEKGFTLEIHPEEANVVGQIFRWYADDRIGVTRIANRLQDMGVPVGDQGGGWAPCRIYRILTNEVYIGLIRWGRVKTKKTLTESGVDKSLHMTDDYELHEGIHEPIIDRELFDRAQTIRHGRSVPMRNDMEQSNPLAGIVRCKHCGHFLRGLPASGRQAAKLYCPTHGCPTVRNYREPVEQAILDTLRTWLQKYTVHLDPFDDLHRTSDDQDAMLQATLEHHLADQSELRKQKSRLHDLLERDVYDLDTFQERLESIQYRLHSLDDSIASIRNQMKQTGPAYCTIDDLAPTIAHVLDVYDIASPAERGQLLRQVISVAEYEKTVRGKPGTNPNLFHLDVFPKVK